MSRQKTKVNSSLDNGKTPSFKVSGVIVLCVVGFMLFGFTSVASAGDISGTDAVIFNTLIFVFSDLPSAVGETIQFIISPLAWLF
jgi:hypothetical protein